MFGFLKQYVSKKTEDVQAGFLRLIVEFDPESASEAEIGELDEVLTKLTRQMVEAKAAWDKEQHEAEEIRKAYGLRVGAAERLQAQMETADAEQKARIEASLGKLVAELNEALKIAALDVKQRPLIKKPRKIVWELALSPTDGGFVSVQAEIPKVSLPRDKAIATICGMPDDEGNLRNLQNTSINQYQLPINFYEGEE